MVKQQLATLRVVRPIRIRDWESTFSTWAQAPGKTEQDRCDNAVRAIRNAVAKSEKLSRRNIKVFPQGSYRNRVNVRKDSDVDVGVMCHDCFLFQYPPGKTAADFGNVSVDYTFSAFKNELEAALVAHFGRASVHRGNKAFDIRANTYHVEADVAPFFEFRRYFDDGSHIRGVVLVTDQGSRIENYPERLLDSGPHISLHYENSVEKNSQTGRRYKGVVRILKSIRNEMEDHGYPSAQSIPGFLLECMAWNVPNTCYGGHRWDADVRAVMLHLWSNTKTAESCKQWCEVNNFKYLFHSSQPWTRDQAHTFIDNAWSYIGLR